MTQSPKNRYNSILSEQSKIHISSKFYKLLSVTSVQVCFGGQGIHFWCYFLDLTKFTRNGGQKGRFLGQKWIKTILPVNNRNVHTMSLEIFFVSRKINFLHML